MSKFEIITGEDKQFYWRLKDNNHEIIAIGGEGFLSEDSAKESFANVCAEVSESTPIVPDGDEKDGSVHTRFAYYCGKDGQWYWRLQNKGNNRKIATGGEGFASKDNVIRSLENVRQELAMLSSVDAGDNSGSSSTTLVVNASETPWDKPEITFSEIVKLDLNKYEEDSKNVAYIVQYMQGPDKNKEGNLVKGQKVLVKDEMIFNVTRNDKS